MTQCFDVLSLETDVQKSYLLEASAGTGKTFTIEHLVARRLKEDPPLILKEILVVTFTNASANDLKERIRNNLKAQAKEDKRIEEALFSFDEAEVHTIHGFCSKMLREVAMEEILAEGGTKCFLIAKEVVKDCFRSTLNPKEFSQAQIKKALKSGMEKLQRDIAYLASKTAKITPLRGYDAILSSFSEKITSLRSLFSDKEKLLQDAYALFSHYRGICDKKREVKQEVKDGIHSFVEKLFIEPKLLLETWIEEGIFWCTLFSEEMKKKGDIGELVYPEFTKTLFQEIKPLVDEAASVEAFQLRIASLCQGRIKERLHEEGVFQFDDLLFECAKRLKDKTFLEAIQSRYRAIIIDEFQDTDPLQWEIFRTIWDKEKMHIYLVGDPKQSIYAFREADIYTYLDAAKTLGEEAHRTLDTNFRSEESLVQALNHIFLSAKEGKWLSLPKIQQELPYRPVFAGGKVEKIEMQDDRGSFHWMVVDKEQMSGRVNEEEYFFPFIVQEIKKLPIPLKDIACLVSDRHQARRLKEALKKGGIPSSLQRKETLKESQALSSVIELIEALFSLHDESSVKLFLSSPLVCWEENDLAAFSSHPLQTKVMHQLYVLQETFKAEGIASCLMKMLQFSWKEDGTPLSIFLKCHDEDLLEDVFQLIECLSSHKSDETILETLYGLKEGDFEDDPTFYRRVDGTKEAVPIVTLHASKGLEWKVVFAIGLKDASKKGSKIISSTNSDQRILFPVFNEEDREWIAFQQELHAERMRQLYVALTRAKHRLYAPLILPKKEGLPERPSPMELFFGDQPRPLLDKLLAFPSITASILSSKDEIIQEVENKPDLKLVAPTPLEAVFSSECVQSFSSMAKAHTYAHKGAPFDFNAPIKNQHTLPAGAYVGTLLHRLLEELSFQDISLDLIKRHVMNTPLSGWEDTIFSMVTHTLNTKLPKGFSLRDVQDERQFREMEFLFDQEGLLKGVIDLCFVHEGIYYLVDWKSNWLGDSEAAYEQASLYQAMEDNAYFLQERLYRDAMRRYLKLFSKEPFEKIFGGTFYLFLRGMDGSSRGIFWIP